jgi:hypothetical protein
MINNSDLDAAVAEGVLTREQARQVRDLARRAANSDAAPIDFSQEAHDEPFRLLRGFRDIFIAMALAIFAVGATGMVPTLVAGTGILEVVSIGTAVQIYLLLISIVLIAVGVALAEWITRRQRLPLASLVLALVFAAWSAAFTLAVGLILLVNFSGDPVLEAEWWFTWSALVGAAAGLIAFYWRYRLPFALMPLAGVIAFSVFLIAKPAFGDAWTSDYGRAMVGVLGIAVFAAAMWYDAQDRLRVKRYSECAFWLHLMAAPMIVHSLLIAGDGADTSVILSVMAALCLVALLIDRRALLVSGLGYLSVAIWQIVARSEFLMNQRFAGTALILGAILLALGLGWAPIRRVVVAAIPSKRIKSVLPPTAGASS